MSIFKCKMCGATLNIPKDTNVFKCEYCDTEQTMPVINSQEKEDLYERANYFFHNNEYDKANKIYEEISNLDPRDPESYFMQSLCKYGIEYVEDPKSKKRIPTLHRLHYEPISNDVNYKKAIKHADSTQKVLYESQAKYIDEVRNKILEISKKEKPYDVFICYKETDEKGQRTEDSVLAMDICNELTKEGLKVFFSRVTLEGKLGIEYEPYIFAALNSAKVMVVVGTKPEYINSPWVRNEWTRFLDRVDSKQSNKNNAEKCYIVPAYKGMSPYALPNEFSSIQAQDMSKVGATQDLVHGIKKLLNKNTNEASKVEIKFNKKQMLIGIGAIILVALLSVIFIIRLINGGGSKIEFRNTEYYTNKDYGTITLNEINDFGTSDVNQLKKLKSINLLSFTYCELDNLEFLSKLKNVKGVLFLETKVNNYNLSEKCENIKTLNILRNSNPSRVNWDSIGFIKNMPNLEEVIMPITKDLSSISNHNNLKKISLLAWKDINIDNYLWCEGLDNVKELRVTNGGYRLMYKDDNPFKGINYLNSIENLDICGSIKGGMALSQADLNNFSELENLISLTLTLTFSTLVDDRETLLSFECFKKLSKLEKLNIRSYGSFDFKGIDDLLELREIKLDWLYSVNDNIINLSKLNKLEILTFGVKKNQKTFSFKGVEGLKNLKQLTIDSYYHGDHGVKFLDEELLNNIDGLVYIVE